MMSGSRIQLELPLLLPDKSMVDVGCPLLSGLHLGDRLQVPIAGKVRKCVVRRHPQGYMVLAWRDKFQRYTVLNKAMVGTIRKSPG